MQKFYDRKSTTPKRTKILCIMVLNMRRQWIEALRTCQLLHRTVMQSQWPPRSISSKWSDNSEFANCHLLKPKIPSTVSAVDILENERAFNSIQASMILVFRNSEANLVYRLHLPITWHRKNVRCLQWVRLLSPTKTIRCSWFWVQPEERKLFPALHWYVTTCRSNSIICW